MSLSKLASAKNQFYFSTNFIIASMTSIVLYMSLCNNRLNYALACSIVNILYYYYYFARISYAFYFHNNRNEGENFRCMFIILLCAHETRGSLVVKLKIPIATSSLALLYVVLCINIYICTMK